MSCTDELPESLEVDVEGGDAITVTVEYPWKPQHCTACKSLRHYVKNCPKYVSTWVPKAMGAQSAATETRGPSYTVPVEKEESKVAINGPSPIVTVEKDYAQTEVKDYVQAEVKDYAQA